MHTNVEQLQCQCILNSLIIRYTTVRVITIIKRSLGTKSKTKLRQIAVNVDIKVQNA